MRAFVARTHTCTRTHTKTATDDSGILIFHAISADPDQTPGHAASDLCLHCWHMPYSEAWPGVMGNKGTCLFNFREQGNIGKYFKGTEAQNYFGKQGTWKFWKSLLGNKRTRPFIIRQQGNIDHTPTPRLGGPLRFFFVSFPRNQSSSHLRVKCQIPFFSGYWGKRFYWAFWAL